MAIIKDFFKEREKRQQDNDVDYRERIRAHKMAVFIRTVIVIAVLVAIVILVLISFIAAATSSRKELHHDDLIDDDEMFIEDSKWDD